MKLKSVYLPLMAAVIAFTADSCRKIEEDGNVVTVDPVITTPTTVNTILSGKITTNTTLKAGNIYKLRGLVYVTNGATLTIEPGTKIVGEADKNGGLIITRGAKIMAEGTASNPIIFTSEKASPKRGDWAGVVLLGKAPTNSSYNGKAGEGEIEGGINDADGNGLYGGTDIADNSGVLKYVRIEYAGYAFLPDKEINGLTFGGVGNGTKVDYVEVAYANDDSFEFFGGTVNCSHLIAYKGLDDDFDTDNGYAGKIQFGIGVRDPQVADVSGSNAFESDNDANGSALTPQTSATFANMTIVGPINATAASTNVANINTLFQNALQIRRNSSISVLNSAFVGYPVGLFIDDTKGTATSNNLKNGSLVFESNVIAAATTPLKASGSYTLADLTTWFNGANNLIKNYGTDVLVAGAWNPAGTTPNFTPTALLQSGANTTSAKLSDAFFQKVAYKGAVKDANDFWYAGWTNFNL